MVIVVRLLPEYANANLPRVSSWLGLRSIPLLPRPKTPIPVPPPPPVGGLQASCLLSDPLFPLVPLAVPAAPGALTVSTLFLVCGTCTRAAIVALVAPPANFQTPFRSKRLTHLTLWGTHIYGGGGILSNGGPCWSFGQRLKTWAGIAHAKFGRSLLSVRCSGADFIWIVAACWPGST